MFHPHYPRCFLRYIGYRISYHGCTSPLSGENPASPHEKWREISTLIISYLFSQTKKKTESHRVDVIGGISLGASASAALQAALPAKRGSWWDGKVVPEIGRQLTGDYPTISVILQEFFCASYLGGFGVRQSWSRRIKVKTINFWGTKRG